MTDDYKKGLITGLAMQPLCVAESSGEVSENRCANCVLTGIVSDEGWCRLITYEEG